MGCRKVRSLLSAYCNGELSSHRKPAVSEHLATCSECRREEAVYRSIAQLTGQVDRLKVSEDFSGRLLDRVARERFAETRSQAFLPRRAPKFSPAQRIPAFVTTVLAVVLLAVIYWPRGSASIDPTTGSGAGLDDSYLTAQPIAAVRQSHRITRNWSLADQMERHAKFNNISNNLTGNRLDGSLAAVATSSVPTPYLRGYQRVRPVVRVYLSPQPLTEREGKGTY